MGPGPITHVEMVAYATLHGFEWAPHEIGFIRALDREFLIFQSEKSKKPTQEVG